MAGPQDASPAPNLAGLRLHAATLHRLPSRVCCPQLPEGEGTPSRMCLSVLRLEPWTETLNVWFFGASVKASLTSIIPFGTPASRPLDNTSTDLPFGLNPHVTEHPAPNGHRLTERGALGKYDAFIGATCRCFLLAL